MVIRPARAEGLLARYLLLLLVAALSPALSFGADPDEVPSVFSKGIWGYAVAYPVYDARGWVVRGGEVFGSSCADACAAAGGHVAFNGCIFTLDRNTWGSGCGIQYSPCPPGYRVGTDNATYGKCVLVPVSWAGPDQDPGRVPGEPDICVGNPCDPATGNKYQVEVDYVGTGPFPLRFVRYYNSLDLAESQSQNPGGTVPRIGLNWRTNLDRRVALFTIGETNFLDVRGGPGRRLRMKQLPGGWTGDPDVSIAVVRSSSLGWKVKNKQDETETYDGNGRLLAITDRAGLSHAFTYGADGRVLQVSDSFGRTLSFGYDSVGRISTMTDPAGRSYAYAYDFNNLASVTYPDGSIRKYVYNEAAYAGGASLPSALTGIVDENGKRFAIYRYTATGKVVGSEHAGGAERVSLTYQSDALTQVSDALQTTRQYQFEMAFGVKRNVAIQEPCADCAAGAAARTMAYDANGNISAITDFNGRLTCYTYDLMRNLEIQRTEGLAGPACPGTPTSATHTTTTEWHPAFRLPLRVARPLAITTYAYDDATGHLLSKSVQPTIDSTGQAGLGAWPAGLSRVWSFAYSYDASTPGLVRGLVVDGPRIDVADTTTYAFNERGDLASISNALGHTVSLGEYDANGRPGRLTDGNGLVTGLGYDLRGRLTSRDAGGEVTSYEYDGVGELVKVIRPDSSALTYTYDAAHRLTQIRDASGSKIVYTLDAMGNRVKEELFDPSGALNQAHTREFDALNRLAKDFGAAAPSAQVTRYEHDPVGNLTTITDPLNRTTSLRYDALDRLIAVTDPGEGVMRLRYDMLDQLAAVTDPRGLATTYRRDGLDNLSSQTSPDTGTTDNAYDEAGNLISSTDARGIVATYTYDALNRLTGALFTPPSGSTLATLSHTYEYDHGANGIGRLTRITDSTGTTSFVYDAHGRLAQDTRLIAGISYATSYRHDSAGHLTGMTYPSGRQVDYTLDSLGRISAITTTRGSTTQIVLAAVSYRPSGEVQSFVFGNGQPYTRSFDLDGRITGYTLGDRSQVLTWDAANRVTALRDAANPANAALVGYDELDRLVSFITPSTSQSFGYDPVGNRLSQTIGANTYSYTYPGSNNRLAGVSGPAPLAYSYDAAGNPAAAGKHILIHDARGRLTQVVNATSGAVLASYQINALGQRVHKTPGSGPARVFLYDSRGRLIGEAGAAGQPLWDHIWLGDLPVAWVSADQDEDGVADEADNCITVANPSQRDLDGDGIGDRCHGDMNGDGKIEMEDAMLIQRCIVHLQPCDPKEAKYDLNENGRLDAADALLVAYRIGLLPGPSGMRGEAANAQVFYVYPDHLGTPRVVTDGQNRVRWRWDNTDPFGANIASEDPDADRLKLAYPLRFPGQYFDKETGLHYNYFRDYDPQTGRYIQSDPIGLAGGVNLYGYVGGMPTRFVDPYGLDVGEPGFGESFIPVWGSGRQAINDFQTGHYVWGSVNSVVALSDVALVGYGVKALCKGAWKLGSHTWGATRKWYGKTRELAPNTPVHHWAIPQGGWGKQVPDIIKNQPWNLNPMPDWATHANIHGYGPDPYNAVGRWWYGTPDWAKIGEGSLAGKAANSLRDDECNCAQ